MYFPEKSLTFPRRLLDSPMIGFEKNLFGISNLLHNVLTHIQLQYWKSVNARCCRNQYFAEITRKERFPHSWMHNIVQVVFRLDVKKISVHPVIFVFFCISLPVLKCFLYFVSLVVSNVTKRFIQEPIFCQN